jgi:ankyrin repeat protein
LASERLLEEELNAHIQYEQQELMKGKTKKEIAQEKEKEKKAKKKEDRAAALKVRRKDSNIHKAINAACLAAQSQTQNPTEILAYLLVLLFPGGDTAVAVNLDDMDQLDNQLAIKVDKNSALEIKNRLGSTPLHHAASHIQAPIECIKLLLQYGADIQARNLSGSSPLHCAAYIGNVKACEILLESVASAVRLSMLSAPNFAGLTSRDYARTQALKALFSHYIQQAKSRPTSAHKDKSNRSRPSSARPKSNIIINNTTAQDKIRTDQKQPE